MSHPAFEIENWVKNNGPDISFNERVGYFGLDIDACKFYFYIKETFGVPNVIYSSVAHFFQNRDATTGNEWCYMFQSGANYIIISGDSKINITVLSLYEPPIELDFHLFSVKINEKLESFSLKKYESHSYDIYVNYSFILNNLISDFKKKVDAKIGKSPELMQIDSKDRASQDPEVHAKYIEKSHDYNHWLKANLEKSALSIQLQILLPIYLESLIDLAFRVMLKKELYNYSKTYPAKNTKYNKDIFKHFEQLAILEKISDIRQNCRAVNESKIEKFIQHLIASNNSAERNKLLHGNSMFFRSSNSKLYFDSNYLIGFPDKFDAYWMISDSIQSSMQEERMLTTITSYENLCNEFIDVFEEEDSFKDLVSGIAFGHNAWQGGSVSIGINKYEDLYSPMEWTSEK